MGNRVFIGLTAGFVAAVLYVTVHTGTLFALFLFYLAPLPLFISGLGWGSVTTVIGGGTGGLLIGAVSGFDRGMLFTVTVAVPCIALTYFLLLSRTVDDDGNQVVEWYPLGRLIVWISAMSAALVCFAVILLGPGADGFEAAIREWFNSVLDANSSVRDRLTQSGPEDLTALIEFLVWALPPASAALWMLTTILNIWLASLVVERSGLATRPKSRYADLDLPPRVEIALALAVGLAFVPGVVGITALSLAAVLAICFTLQGLAVVHTLSRGMRFRPAILGLAYGLLLFGRWIGFCIILGIGLVEAVWRLRDRFAGPGGSLTSNHSTSVDP